MYGDERPAAGGALRHGDASGKEEDAQMFKGSYLTNYSRVKTH